MTPAAPPPRTPGEVLERYTELQQSHQQLHDNLSKRRGNAFKGFLALLVVLRLATVSVPSGNAWLMIGGFAGAVGLIWFSLRLQPQLAREQRLLAFYDRALRRANGSEPQSGRTGTEAGQVLRQPGHLYDRDLDLLGENSLFGLLATVRTGPGERGLARYLLEPAPHQQTLARQASVRELLPNTELREQIALLGTTSFHQISASFFDEWLDELPPDFPLAYRFALFVTAALNLALLLTGLTHLRPWGFVLPLLALVLAIQGAMCLVLHRKVVPLLNSSARLQQHIRLISEGLALLQSATFATPLLAALQRKSFEPSGAVKLLKQLESSLTIVEQRTKEYFLIFSLFLAAGTQAAISIARWKHQHAPAMRSWLAAWSEFEALNALATYAYENPQNTWPELLPPTHPPHFAATGLGHPLLASAITNDITLGAFPNSDANHFYLISGSNMAGKSTLLRSIGINAVLAYAGAPVRAQSLALTPLTLGASLALTDSLAEGRSKFLAEVERLSSIVKASQTTPVLFLVDEIFSGTNSEDRRTAARAVLDTLLRNHAIGALSTHDLALTELANPTNTGLNVHMASPDPDDPLAFDYKLKPGINTASNALAIVRMMGL